LALALCASGFAAEPGPAPVIDMEARKASVVNLEALIGQREKRLAELGQDIITIDARIEKRIDELVKMLADTRDSQDSRTKVSKVKEEAIEGLRRAINLYVTKRKEIRERARTGDEASLGDLGKFDQRIFKRVDQIVEISKSIPTHKDVDKYESDGGSYWNGYYNESTRISEAWKQNRRDSNQADKQRDETTKALPESLDRLDQRRRSLKDLLENRNPTEAARKLYIQELGEIDAYTSRLNTELIEVTLPTGSSATRQPSLDEAIDLERLLDDARKDLREDASTLFRLYDQFASGRANVNALKENLAARKAWLEKNAGGGNGGGGK
jgi:hypothetical protein